MASCGNDLDFWKRDPMPSYYTNTQRVELRERVGRWLKERFALQYILGYERLFARNIQFPSTRKKSVLFKWLQFVTISGKFKNFD